MARTRAKPTDFRPDVIAATALEILAKEGPEAVSFRRVGDALGTNHVLIYRRCGSFDGLLDLCADAVAATLPAVDPEAPWDVATQQQFEAVFEMWTAHVDLVMLMGGRPWLGENMLSRFYEPVMEALIRGGMTPLQAGYLFSILYRTTIGAVISTRPDHWNPHLSVDNLERLGATRFPALALVEEALDKTDITAVYRDSVRQLIAHFGTDRMRSSASSA